MKLSKIKEIFDAYSVMVDPTSEQSVIAAQRLEICNSCSSMNEIDVGFIKVKVCNECGCFLKAKVFVVEKTACPKNKWKI